MISACPYLCDNKTEYGYCKTTGCINPKVSSCVGYAGYCAVNAQEVVTEDCPHWVWDKPNDDCRCSICGKIVDQRYPYCPWCGMKMK